MSVGDDWRRYPFELVPGDPHFVFPAAEANHPTCESDTWFLAGELTGETDRKFAFLTIFNKNRPGQAIVADFYTLALFDLDNGTYGTYTDYDMPSTNKKSDVPPKLTVGDDHLDMTYDSRAGTAVWRTCRDEAGELLPYTYDVTFCGTDQHGSEMRLDLHVTPSRAPVPLGAAAYNGVIECFGQATTYSYFQTGMTMTGTLSWGSVQETVTGYHRPRRPAVVSAGGQRRWRDRRHPLPRPRMAHDQSGQRRRPEHLAAVRSDESQCAAAVFGRHDELAGRRP